jgi:hypothetical protein
VSCPITQNAGISTNNFATEHGWEDEEKPEESIDPTGGRFGNGQIAQDLEKEHEKLKQQKGDDGEPLKSAV